MIKRTIALLCAALVFFTLPLCLSGCSGLNDYKREFYTMDTVINITVYDTDKQHAERALDAAQGEFERIDNLTDRFSQDEKSDIYRVNKNAGVATVKVSEDTIKIIDASLYWGKKSGGAFNIAIGPLMDLWGFGKPQQRVPSDAEIKSALSLCNLDDVVLNKDGSTVFLKKSGMSLDLGGVAKGYATDKAVEALKASGIKSALINAGGNVFVIGQKQNADWKVGIQNPREQSGLIGVVTLKDRSVISSGDYERYFIVGDKRYHHILDPNTGYPADKAIETTIISGDGATGDIFSTLFFVLGKDQAFEFLNQYAPPGTGLMIIGSDKKIYTNQELKKYLALSENTGFSMGN